ncbi:heterokaryon incompatibility protein-domain-containing protein [Rhexocercosporidium sp. MPI-PUGE-AT-0058]|nr:heterokaryon incompatibility protein-domain-containing protein [Rhexocercosporidium sp. MPI-PUGE-AT-0058]
MSDLGQETSQATPLSHLCETCRSIDFKSHFIDVGGSDDELKPPGASRPLRSKLGYLDDIIDKSSSCELCALLIACARRLNDGQDPPTEQGGARVEAELDQQFLCTADDVDFEGKVVGKMEVYRCLVNFQPAIFGFFSKIRFQIHKEGSGTPGFGRLMDSSIDPKQLKDWLHTCEESHGADCNAPEWLGEPCQPSFLKVIDVEKRCVVPAPPNCRYVALSYVWGDPNEVKSRLWLMKMTNVAASQMHNGLDFNLLPTTITDSMDLVSKIGERYLWVDALCIVQDDEKELAEQTSQMDLVYACALATIIVATGESAEAGLPGVNNPRSLSQTKVDIGGGYHLMETVAQGNASHLQNSSWNSRGWTFQERLLSRRALIVTPDQIYWECEHNVLSEEVHLETGGTRIWVLPQAMDCNDEWDDRAKKFSRNSFSSYVTRYSTRRFTYQSDALAAFSGILRRMEYRNKQQFYWATPYDLFDQALTWKYGSTRRTELCQLLADGEPYKLGFPSWSWLGWCGFIGGYIFNYEMNNDRIAGKSKSEIDFYRLYADGHVEQIVDHTVREKCGPDDKPLPEGFPEPPHSAPFRQGTDFSQNERWKGPSHIESSVPVPKIDFNLPAHVDPACIDTGRLVFWTSIAKLKVQSIYDDDMIVEIAGQQVTIKISEGTVVEEFNRRVAASMAKKAEGAELSEQDSVASELEGVNTITLLDGVGEDNAKKEASDHDSNDLATSNSILPSEGVPAMMEFIVVSRYWPVGIAQYKPESLNLLIVTFSEAEPEVARRIGTGLIVEEDWIAADREWKRVILA